MLTYEALLRQAEDRGMPPNKARGVLREYLQIVILKELYGSAAGKKLYFTGGTYLRLLHNLKRFSEDLDFNTDAIKRPDFEGIIEKIAAALKKTGLNSKVSFKHRENIYAANLVFPDIEKAYEVVSRFSTKAGIMIKIETNRPQWKIGKEALVISGFGEFFPVICTERGALFADKIDALRRKTRARHLYDIMFMLANGFPVDMKVLSVLGIKDEPLTAIADRVKAFSVKELKEQAESLRPFLFNEKEADMIVNAHSGILSLIDGYRSRNR